MNGKVIDAAILLSTGIGKHLAEAEKRLDILYKLTEGTAWDTETDAQAAYQKTVPSGAVAAEIGMIGGNTVVWNQHMQPVTAENFTSILHTADIAFTDGVCTFTATAKGGFVGRSGGNTDKIVAGHVYLRYAEVKADEGTSLYVYGDGGYASKTIAASGGWDAVRTRFSPQSGAIPSTAFSVTDNRESGWTPVSFRRVWLFDLTQCFGSDAPTTSSDPRISDMIAYASEHPEYDAGSLLSAAVTSVVSRDAEDAETLGTLEVPAAVRALDGYGQSAVGGDGNTLDLSAGTYTEIGHYVDGVWTALAEPVVTDVSALLPDNMLGVEAGGTLTFAQDGGTTLDVPNSVDYLVKLSEVEA